MIRWQVVQAQLPPQACSSGTPRFFATSSSEIGLAQAVLLTVWRFETTRFFCSRLRAGHEEGALGRAQVFMPCKGVEPRFVDTVRSMLAQEYPHYRLTFVVEAMTDPAWSVLQQLLQSEVAERNVALGTAILESVG